MADMHTQKTSDMTKRYCLTNYTVQCRDVLSGRTGCFLFDIEHYRRHGEFKATSPVLPDLVAFYAWDNANGMLREGLYVEYEGVSEAMDATAEKPGAVVAFNSG